MRYGKVDPSEELLDGHLDGSVGRAEVFQPLNSSTFVF